MSRTALVTGAASGIGRATAFQLAGDGCRIVVLDVNEPGAQLTVNRIREQGGQADAVAVDLADPGSIESVFGRLLAAQTPDILVNNAGIGVAADVIETDPADWDRLLAVNLTAMFHTCRLTIPGMLERGSGVVVNVASAAGVVGIARRAAYCASKAGVIGLTRSIAADFAGRGIRANAICPGTVDTEWIGKILASAPDPTATRAAMDARQLDGRMGSPREVAAGIAFLCRPEARFVNGSAFIMDGGMTAV